MNKHGAFKVIARNIVVDSKQESKVNSTRVCSLSDTCELDQISNKIHKK